MSLTQYTEAKEISHQHYGFVPLIMAAMLTGTATQLEEMRRTFPVLWDEVQGRNVYAGGVLPTDRQDTL